jgi:hypothetical protein
MAPHLFYKYAFAVIGVPFWLTWAAAVLALISTASIFPDFVSSGSIELLLSRPLGRLRLYFTKYFSGLLFVALQVVVFSAASFVVIAIRGQSLEWGVFLAVPIVVLFFSYLFCVLAVVGQLTRSTVAALLVTILFWVTLFSLKATEHFLLVQRERYALDVEDLERMLSLQEERAQHAMDDHADGKTDIGLDEGSEPEQLTPEQANPFIVGTRHRLEAARTKAETWARWHGRIMLPRTILPKTQETIALLEHGLISKDEDLLLEVSGRSAGSGGRTAMDDPRVTSRVQHEVRKRSRLWIIGTSLLFEAVVLAFGAWRFCRRDF